MFESSSYVRDTPLPLSYESGKRSTDHLPKLKPCNTFPPWNGGIFRSIPDIPVDLSPTRDSNFWGARGSIYQIDWVWSPRWSPSLAHLFGCGPPLWHPLRCVSQPWRKPERAPARHLPQWQLTSRRGYGTSRASAASPARGGGC